MCSPKKKKKRFEKFLSRETDLKKKTKLLPLFISLLSVLVDRFSIEVSV